jgi:hypothetical protein
MTETEVQNKVLLNASKLGWRLWRNNVGVAFRSDGVPVRYGLANANKAMNQNLKSADLIGIKPVLITQGMVGQTIGVFTSIECKGSSVDLTKSPTARMVAQNAWRELINRFGGNATVNNSGVL